MQKLDKLGIISYYQIMLKHIDTQHNNQKYRKSFADCIVLTKDQKILLQQRPVNPDIPGNITAFGGQIEAGETPEQAIVRELNEELGAKIEMNDLYFIGAVTEDWTNHQDIVHLFFWHDKAGNITGCYEFRSITFNIIDDALKQDGIMEYARWGLEQSRRFLQTE